jgi:hypothetical protein
MKPTLAKCGRWLRAMPTMMEANNRANGRSASATPKPRLVKFVGFWGWSALMCMVVRSRLTLHYPTGHARGYARWVLPSAAVFMALSNCTDALASSPFPVAPGANRGEWGFNPHSPGLNLLRCGSAALRCGFDPHGCSFDPHGCGFDPHGCGFNPHGCGFNPRECGSEGRPSGFDPHQWGSDPLGWGFEARFRRQAGVLGVLAAFLRGLLAKRALTESR